MLLGIPLLIPVLLCCFPTIWKGEGGLGCAGGRPVLWRLLPVAALTPVVVVVVLALGIDAEGVLASP